MKSIGIIGPSGLANNLQKQMQELFSVYVYDTNRPLELLYNYKGKTCVIRDVEGYFCPLAEIVKLVDGPIFICFENKEIVKSLLHQINDSIPKNNYFPVNKPNIFVLSDVE